MNDVVKCPVCLGENDECQDCNGDGSIFRDEMPTREDMIEYFEELCGPHLDRAIYEMSLVDLLESWANSRRESLK